MKTMLPVKHPHIIQLYNAGKSGPYCWAAMEYVDGESMTEVIRRIGVEGMLDWREAYRVAVHIGRALDEAYGAEDHPPQRHARQHPAAPPRRRLPAGRLDAGQGAWRARLRSK